MVEPLWFKIVLVIIQGVIGAGSALLAVMITQKRAQKERQQAFFDRIFEPRFLAHKKVFDALVDFQDRFRISESNRKNIVKDNCSEIRDVMKKEIIWIDDKVSHKIIDLIEDLGVGVEESKIINRIYEIQKLLRESIGIDEYSKIVSELKTKEKGNG